MSEFGAGGGQRSSPRREDIIAALEAEGGGPVQAGPLAFAVCAVMGVDTSNCQGSYELRQLRGWSWAGYTTRLRQMVRAQELVARTRQQWHTLSGGRLFPDLGHGDVLAYALVSVDARARSGVSPQVWEQALKAGMARVLREHRALVERYAQEWLEAR